MPGQTLIGTRIALTVERIAHAGVVDMAHVHANLMRATGKQVTLNECVAVIKARGIKALKDLKGRDGLARKRIIGNRHLDTVTCRTGNAGVNGASSMAI